jgi:hypothetical protein
MVLAFRIQRRRPWVVKKNVAVGWLGNKGVSIHSCPQTLRVQVNQINTGQFNPIDDDTTEHSICLDKGDVHWLATGRGLLAMFSLSMKI